MLRHVAEKVVLLRPLWALILLFFGPCIVVPISLFVPDGYLEGTASAICMLFYVGWPYLVTVYFGGPFEIVSTKRLHLLTVCLIYVVSFNFFALHIHELLMTDGVIKRIAEGVLILLVAWCTLFVMWSAAQAMTRVERDRSISANSTLPTFFLFLLLPFGVWFIRRRIQRIYLP